MKKIIFMLVSFMLLTPSVYAKQGCCSRHGGVSGCTSSGRTICADGTLSPTCTCTPPVVYGCTDPKAKNYNPNANKSDNSCKYEIKGCTDSKAKNYNSKATKDDGTCTYYVYGCMDKNASNYNPDAEKSDDSCLYDVKGCMDKKAENYNEQATIDDGTCKYKTTTPVVATKPTQNNEEKDNSDNSSGVIGVIGLIVGIPIIRAAIKKKKS